MIKANPIAVMKRMAFSGDHEVIIAIEPQLHRGIAKHRCNRSPDRRLTRLGFLSAESAAHASALDSDRMILNAQGMGYPVLHLAGMLGAGVNQPLALFLRAGVGDLTLKIKMLLAADTELARACCAR